MRRIFLPVFSLAVVAALAFATVAAGAVTTEVVKPSAMNGWGFLSEGTAGDAGSFVAGPGTAPLGNGSVRLQVNAATQGLLLAKAVHQGMQLSDITSMSYSTYRSSLDAGDNLAATIQLGWDDDSTTNPAFRGRLVFEPYLGVGGGTVLEDTWQTWNPLTTTDGWWATNGALSAFCSQGNSCSWSEVMTTWPNAEIDEGIFGFVGFKMGSGIASFDGNVDNFVIGTAADSWTYNFEPETQCTTTCFVDDSGNDTFGGDTPASAKKTIQAAIDAVASNGTVRVLPGTYDETASGRGTDTDTGPYQFGLFFPPSKDGITLQGVTAGNVAITNANNVATTVTTNATNNFGYSGVYVSADGITIRGMGFGQNTPASDAKTIEVTGNGFTFDASKINSDASLYIGDTDGRYNNGDTPLVFGDDTSYIQTYAVTNNIFDGSSAPYIANGAGFSGAVSGRVITGNQFTATNPSPVSFAGPGSAGWLIYPVGAAVFTGNTFTNEDALRYIQAWGTQPPAPFDWSDVFTLNSYPHPVVTTTDGNLDNIRPYTAGVFTNIYRVGAVIQNRVDNALSGDTVIAGAGTFKEQVTISIPLTLTGAGASSTILDGVNDTGVGIAIQNAADITVEDLKVTRFDIGITVGIGGSSAASDVVVEDVDAVNNGNHGLMSGTFDLDGLTITRGNYSDNGTAPLNPNNNGRGIYLTDENKTNITIEDVTASNNQLVGIDLNDGDVSGLAITDNTVVGNGDSGIGVLGPEGPGATLIDNNTVTNNGRFGIEIKVPTGNGAASGPGSIVVSNNNVSRTVAATNLKDYAGIAVFRRAGSAFNADQPTGVVVTGNTVSGFVSNAGGSTGDGFGIVVEGTNHNVNHNTVTGNDVGIQAQAGNTADVQNTDWFDRGNASSYSGLINRNSIAGNTLGLRTAGLSSAANTECNWWGNSTGPSGVGTGSGDTVSANADFTPWLTASNLNGACNGIPQEIDVTPASGHDFGNQNVNDGATAAFTYTVTNVGNIDLVLGTVSITGTHLTHFIVDSNVCSGQTLAPSANCTIGITFDPSSAGAKTATLNIPSNDVDEPNVTRALSGNGTTGPTTGSINILLNSVPNSAQDFSFTGDTGNFILDDDSNNARPNSRTVSLAPGTYIVTQAAVAGWSLTSLSCNTGESTSIPTRTATITLTAGENVVCTFTDTHRLADALVSKKANKKYAGDNIYSSSVLASQTRNLAVARNTTKKLFFRFQNASLATDSFTIDANLSGSASFSVTFFNGATDITAQVLAGTYTLNNLGAGAQVTIEARITAASNTAASATRNIDVFQTSTSEPSVMDVVRGHITRA